MFTVSTNTHTHSPHSVAILFQQRSLQLPDPLHANVILLDPVVRAPLPVLRRLGLSWCLGDCVNCATRSSCFRFLDVLVGFLSAGRYGLDFCAFLSSSGCCGAFLSGVPSSWGADGSVECLIELFLCSCSGFVRPCAFLEIEAELTPVDLILAECAHCLA